MASSDSRQETAALLAAIKEPLPAAKRLTHGEQAALSNRLYLSLDTEGRSLKERQQESEAKLQDAYSGLFQPRSSHRARSPTRAREEAEQEAEEGEAGVLRLVSLCGRGEWTAVRQLLQARNRYHPLLAERGGHSVAPAAGTCSKLLSTATVSPTAAGEPRPRRPEGGGAQRRRPRRRAPPAPGVCL